jgi:hypothetical protein
MARLVKSADDFARELKNIRARPPGEQPRVLAFFLFDERKSHRMAANFVERQFSWLDSLADAADMVLFFFLPKSSELVESTLNVLVARSERTRKNPSLYVARAFGLGPDDLPGVVFFTELDIERPGPHEGVFWPLAIELFKEGGQEAEKAFSDLFTLVQQASMDVLHPKEFLAELRRRVEAKDRRERLRPVFAGLREGAVGLVRFPGKLLEAVAMAFGEGLARRVTEG